MHTKKEKVILLLLLHGDSNPICSVAISHKSGVFLGWIGDLSTGEYVHPSSCFFKKKNVLVFNLKAAVEVGVTSTVLRDDPYSWFQSQFIWWTAGISGFIYWGRNSVALCKSPFFILALSGGLNIAAVSQQCWLHW